MTSNSKAIKQLKGLIEDKQETVTSLAAKLAIARGTLLGILSGTSEPRLGVILAARKLGIDQKDWT